MLTESLSKCLNFPKMNPDSLNKYLQFTDKILYLQITHVMEKVNEADDTEMIPVSPTFYNEYENEDEAVTESVVPEYDSGQYHKEAKKYLTECIQHHQRLIDFSEKLDELVSNIFFLQFLTASLMICFLGFRITTMDLDINLMKLLSYLLTVICQLCLYCVFGSNLMSQSEEIHNAIYESDWCDQSKSFRDSIRMIIMRAQRPVSISAGRFGALSLPLFASMMQTSYSYLALLMQLNEEQEEIE